MFRKDNENYGSKRTMIGCKERGGPRDQLSSQFLRGDDLKDEGWEPRRTGARERSPAATIVCSMWLTAASILYYIVGSRSVLYIYVETHIYVFSRMRFTFSTLLCSWTCMHVHVCIQVITVHVDEKAH